MNRRSSLHTHQRSRALILIGFLAAVSVVACTEKLESGAACPVLCPQQSVELKDTIIDAVAIDSTQPGYPPIGQETELLLAARGDTLDTRIIVRFDTLAKTFTNVTTMSTNHGVCRHQRIQNTWGMNRLQDIITQ